MTTPARFPDWAEKLKMFARHKNGSANPTKAELRIFERCLYPSYLLARMFDLLQFDQLDPFEKIDFCEGYDPVDPLNPHVYHYPFSCIAILRNDDFQRLATGIERKKMKMKEDFPHSEALQRKRSLVEEQQSDLERRFLTESGIDDVRPYKRSTVPGNSNYKKPKPRKGEVIFDNNMQNPEWVLVNEIRNVVPSPEVTNELLDSFFADLFPFMPFVIEAEFRATMAKLVTKGFTLTRRMDLAFIGTLLMVLKLTYTALELQGDSPPPLDRNLDAVAEQCYYQIRNSGRPGLELIQMLVYMRIYKKLSPQNGESVMIQDRQAVTAEMVYLAKTLGLHRDGKRFKLSEEQVDLRRRLWYFILDLDLEQAIECGCNLIVREEEYDTELPSRFFDSADHAFRLWVARFFSTIFNYKQPSVDLVDVIFLLDALEADAKFDLDHMNAHSLQARFKHFYAMKRFIRIQSFLGALFVHLTFHFEKRRNTTLFFTFVQKTAKVCLTTVKLSSRLPTVERMLGLKNAEFLVAPHVINLSTKFNLVLKSLMLRSIHAEHEALSDSSVYSAITNRFEGLLLACSKLWCAYFERRPYYLCWNYLESHKFFAKIFLFLRSSFATVYGPGVRMLDNAGEEIEYPISNGLCELSRPQLQEFSEYISLS